MEIIKKTIISVNTKSEEVKAVIDTGAEKTMINEEVLLRLGAPHITNIPVQTIIRSRY